MSADADVLVIGGGSAGVAAALAAASAGARVTLVRRGPGATALAAGGWDMAPPEPMRSALATAGLELSDCPGGLPHPDGTLVASRAAPSEHVRAAVASGTARSVVCGIAGLPGFRPRALAELWADAAGMPPRSLDAVLLELPDTPPAGWSPRALASRIERQPHELGVAIARAARESAAARAIVPAVLGLARSQPTLRAVQDAAGLDVGEALGVAPSIPGWRLDRALVQTLESAAIPLIQGRVYAHEAARGRILAVTIERDGGALTIRAAAVVLATGKFLGGGIASADTFTETALGCDVAIERFGRSIADAAAALVLTDPARREPQPLLALGVRTNDVGVPLFASGDIAFENVVAAGSVRYGIETGAGLGAAAHDGWTAGARATTLVH